MHRSDDTLRLSVLSLACMLFVTSVARAQEAVVTAPLSKDAIGETKTDDETVFSASLGGSLNTGNTESWQLTAGTELRLVRMPHAFGFNAALAYGKADVPDDLDAAGTPVEDFKDTVKNFNTKARYEYYLTRMDALFLAAAFRWDEFAGLDARVQGQAGYLRNFVKTDDQRFWGELGYDITFDDFHPDPLLDPATGAVLPGDDVTHSGRLFFGYDGHLNQSLAYIGGLEGLVNVEEAKDTRINWENALRSALGGNFQLELKFTLKYDNVPVPGTEKVDTTTLLSLLYSYIEAPEPPPTCPCPEEAAPAPEAAPKPEAAPAASEPAPATEAETGTAPVTEAAPAATEAAPAAEAAPATPAPAAAPPTTGP